MIKADILINNKDWIRHIRFPSTYINKKLKKIDKKSNIFKKNNFKFTVLLSEDREIKKLNKQFRKKNKTTDILSFPCHKKKNIILLLKKKNTKIYLGDIIINLNKIILKIKKKEFLPNFDKLLIHGLVHLLGYRHKSNRDFGMMTKVENQFIKSLK